MASSLESLNWKVANFSSIVIVANFNPTIKNGHLSVNKHMKGQAQLPVTCEAQQSWLPSLDHPVETVWGSA